MIEAGNVGGCPSGPACTKSIGWSIDEGFVGGVGGETEPLSATVATIEEDDGTVGKESTFDHTTSFRHGIKLPGGVGRERLNPTATRICGAGYVLVSPSTADDDIGSPVVGAREGKENTTAGIGISAVVAGKVRKSFGGGITGDIEDLGRFGNKDEESSVI